MSAGGVIGDLTQSLNCGGNCDCCFQSKVQQQELSNQLSALSQRIAKIERYINQLDAAVTRFDGVFKDAGKALTEMLKLIAEMFVAGLFK
jgi:prefoldin subunit 5